MFFLVIYTILLAVSALWGILLWKRLSAQQPGLRATFSLLPVSFLNLAALFFLKMKEAYFYDPNWERLQNAFALAAGDAVYYGLNQGPILNTMYGPVAVLAFWPAVLAHAPASVMAIASSLGVFYFFGPIFYLHAARFFQRGKFVNAAFGVIFFAGIAIFSSPLRNAGFRIHADAPALGLGALACVILILNRQNAFRFSLAALAAVLSVWSKQVMAPLIVSTFAYLWIAESGAVARRYAFWILFWGALVSALFVLRFGAEPLFINMFYIPGRQPLRDGWFLASLWKLFRECLLPLIAVAAFFPVFSKMPWAKPIELVRQNRWTIFLLAALFLIPTSILGNGKLGGSNNTLSYTVYFLLAAFTLAISDSEDFPGASRFSMALVLLVLLGIQIPSVYYRHRKMKKFADFPSIVFDYVKNNPEKGFFPRLNVFSIMNEKKIYHTSCGMIDRKWAEVPVTPEHLRAHLPAQMEFIAFRESVDDDKQFFDLPEFWYISPEPALPGFRIYRKK